jgi:hypothetical protein
MSQFVDKCSEGKRPEGRASGVATGGVSAAEPGPQGGNQRASRTLIRTPLPSGRFDALA